MDQIKLRLGQRSVLIEFMLITFVLAMLTIYLSVSTIEFASDAYRKLNTSYDEIVPYEEIIAEGGVSRKYVVINRFSYFTPVDKAISIVYQALPFISVPVYAVALLGFGMMLFYKRRVKVPYNLMIASSRKIANRDLNFEIHYESKDEFGQLCAAFEKMRVALVENNSEMWRTAEERKRLNAAFSHDLRTPLTVIKGHIDFLEIYFPENELSKEEVLSTIGTIKGHIERLERYVHSMSSIQKLEEIKPAASSVSGDVFLSGLEETAKILCENKRLIFKAKASADILRLDTEMVSQVFENL